LTWLPNEIGKFDFIAAKDLDRVMNPKGNEVVYSF
ncbi:hypothetical protein AC249_AIPGENE24361, partial [Exaiptasia diaphana]